MTAILSYALTSVSDVKESLGIAAGDTSKDNLITRKINQATENIEAYCALPYGHHFKESTYTNEEYDGSNSDQLVLFMRPVTAVSSFQQRQTSENISSWDTVDSSLYYFDIPSGIVKGLFGLGNYYNNYRVSYTAGYATIPADLAEACVILAGELVSNASSGTGVKAKSEGNRRIEYFDTNQSSSSLIDQLNLDDMLARYKNYVV